MHYMEVIGQLQVLAALLPVPIGWVPEPVWTRWRREKNPCPCRELNSVRPARSLVTTLTLHTHPCARAQG